MALSEDDLNKIQKLIRLEVDEKLKAKGVSTQIAAVKKEAINEVRKSRTDAHEETISTAVGISYGFENMLRQVVDNQHKLGAGQQRLEERMDTIAPAAKGAEVAAVEGAKAAVLTEGKIAAQNVSVEAIDQRTEKMVKLTAWHRQPWVSSLINLIVVAALGWAATHQEACNKLTAPAHQEQQK